MVGARGLFKRRQASGALRREGGHRLKIRIMKSFRGT